MLRCGHSEQFRSMITTRAVAKYRNSLKNHSSGTKVMYRTRQEMTRQWEKEGGKPTKSDWFCKSGATGVLNIPASKDSRLAEAVQKALDTVPGPAGSKITVQERPGRSVKQSLVTANPFPRSSCGRKFCPWVTNGEQCRERCYRESIGYVARCRRCHTAQQEEGVEEKDIVEKVYIGESSRSCTTRSTVHFSDYRQEMRRGKKKRKDVDEGEGEEGREEGRSLTSWMADHAKKDHKGEMDEDDIRKDYEFAITGNFLKPLHRQVDEHLRMEKAETTGKVKIGRAVWKVDKVLLNNKEESWSPKAAVYSSVYSSSQSQPRVRAGGTKYIRGRPFLQHITTQSF